MTGEPAVAGHEGSNVYFDLFVFVSLGYGIECCWEVVHAFTAMGVGSQGVCIERRGDVLIRDLAGRAYGGPLFKEGCFLLWEKATQDGYNVLSIKGQRLSVTFRLQGERHLWASFPMLICYDCFHRFQENR